MTVTGSKSVSSNYTMTTPPPTRSPLSHRILYRLLWTSLACSSQDSDAGGDILPAVNSSCRTSDWRHRRNLIISTNLPVQPLIGVSNYILSYIGGRCGDIFGPDLLHLLAQILIRRLLQTAGFFPRRKIEKARPRGLSPSTSHPECGVCVVQHPSDTTIIQIIHMCEWTVNLLACFGCRME